jgi:3-oxoacyl-[acyl-carrier protein] reductase
MARLGGKVAVITGAGGALGRELALAFASEGAAVVCQDVREDAATLTARSVTAAGGTAEPAACDVTDSAAIEQLFDTAAARFGVVDVLVNNAGVENTPGDASGDKVGIEQLAAMGDDGWRAMLEINLTGAFICSRAMIRRLLDAERGGSIICIASIVPLTGYGPVHYAAAKAGMIGMVRNIAVSGGDRGIRANAIAPGMLKTPMSDARPAEQEFVRRRTPLRRLGLPADITPLAVYLASDESSFVTAQTITANGGVFPL